MSWHWLARALGPLAIGLVLALASHPDIAQHLISGQGQRAFSVMRLTELGLDHLLLSAVGLALVGSLGIGFGLLAIRSSAVGIRSAIDAVAAFAQGLPPVVVVALALPVVGFGGPPTLLALVAYGLMPTLRGTIGAIEAVPREARESALALGLTQGQILRQVELPLAAPGILDALRIALLLSVATTAVGALAGASTLGTPIVAGLQNQNLLAMWQGAAATAALAFIGDAAMLAIAGALKRV